MPLQTTTPVAQETTAPLPTGSCQALYNRQNECPCDEDGQCMSGVCRSGVNLSTQTRLVGMDFSKQCASPPEPTPAPAPAQPMYPYPYQQQPMYPYQYQDPYGRYGQCVTGTTIRCNRLDQSLTTSLFGYTLNSISTERCYCEFGRWTRQIQRGFLQGSSSVGSLFGFR